MKCSNCGFEFTGKFCPECGTPAQEAAKPQAEEAGFGWDTPAAPANAGEKEADNSAASNTNGAWQAASERADEPKQTPPVSDGWNAPGAGASTGAAWNQPGQVPPPPGGGAPFYNGYPGGGNPQNTGASYPGASPNRGAYPGAGGYAGGGQTPPVGHYQPQYPAQPPQKKKLWIIPVVIVAAVLVLGIIGFFVFNNFQKGIKSLEWHESAPVTITAMDQTEKSWVVVEPADFEKEDILFVSDDESVATISSGTVTSGGIWYEITPVGDGSTVVYAQSKDGSIKTKELVVNVAIAPEAPKEETPNNNSLGDTNKDLVGDSDFAKGDKAPAVVQQLIDIIKPTVAQNFKDYSSVVYDKELNAIVISVAAEGVTAEVVQIYLAGGDETNADWSYLRKSMLEMYDSMAMLMDSMDASEYSLCISLLNDQNKENVLLMIMDGEVVYDVLEK